MQPSRERDPDSVLCLFIVVNSNPSPQRRGRNLFQHWCVDHLPATLAIIEADSADL
jgi:hypothetical protein